MTTPIEKWVEEQARLFEPKSIYWCDGSEGEARRLMELGLREEEIEGNSVFHKLDQRHWPNAYLHRSHPTDVARTEHLTFLCHPDRETAGPNNNWMEPKAAKELLTGISRGAMRGRTMYVLPFMMGHPESPYAKACVQITDITYVAVSMRIMTRLGRHVLDKIGGRENFIKGIHSVGDFDPGKRYIMHFPDEKLVWSIGSGYGGNALLGKKCISLRIASCLGRKQGWLAEHMVIIGVEDIRGNVTYLTAAMPSACGKTNLAMLQSALPEYRVWTVGDDIAWLNVGPDGRLWAINPESGFFGVAPGTSMKTNPNMIETLKGSRFTVSLYNCPSLSPKFDSPQGVPISAVIFGGRRSSLVPLVTEAFNWEHGVFMGARTGSETTAAATGQVGVVRRDPMAMLPFCGYNMGLYFRHWINMGGLIPNPPRIFSINAFRTDAQGRFLWPGFGENIRILKWILDRTAGKVGASETPLGLVPHPEDLDLSGLDMPQNDLRQLLEVKNSEWRAELGEIKEFLGRFGRQLPHEIRREYETLARRIGV